VDGQDDWNTVECQHLVTVHLADTWIDRHTHRQVSAETERRTGRRAHVDWQAYLVLATKKQNTNRT